MAVIRTPLPGTSYTMLRNCWLRDARINYKAKGLLAYLMSHEDGYKCSQAQMVRESADGKDAIRTALDDLAAAGYLRRVPSRSSGRFAEDDYALADPFDSTGQLIPDRRRETRPFTATDERETRQSGFSGADKPRREIRPLEDNQENPVPSEQASQLRLVEDEAAKELERIVNAVAGEHWEAVGKVAPFPGIRSIVKAALAAGHPEPQVRAALAALRRQRRSLTKNALGLLLAAPAGTVPGEPYGPYRNQPAHAYEGQF